MHGSGWPWDCLTVARKRCIPMEPWTGAVNAAICKCNLEGVYLEVQTHKKYNNNNSNNVDNDNSNNNNDNSNINSQ